MKRIIFVLLISIVGVMSLHAQNRWNVYAGGSISHLCEKPVIGSDRNYGWGGGAFLGAGYEINFNSHWSLTPQIEFNYIDNGAVLHSKGFDFSYNHSQWQGVWNINIPVLAGFRFKVADNVRLRFGAGVFLQEALAGKHYNLLTDKKESLSGNFSVRFNFGPIGEAAVETGNHFSYMFRTYYPALQEGWTRKTITLSLGVRYSF